MRQPPRTRAGVRFFRDGFAQGFPARPKSARAGRAAWYAIAQAARNAQQNQAVEFTGESDQLALNVAYGADYAEGKVLGSKRENDAYYYVSRPSAHVGWTGLSFLTGCL